MSIEQPFNSPPDIRALSANIHDITTDNAIPPDAWDALAELRDALAKDEKIGWWVVYNGDPERAYDPDSSSSSSDDEADADTGESVTDGVVKDLPQRPTHSSSSQVQTQNLLPIHAGRSSSEEKEVHITRPASSAHITEHRHHQRLPSSGVPPQTQQQQQPGLRSPTGGRVPPPIPPPPKTPLRPNFSTMPLTQTQTQTPPGSRGKELPPPPPPPVSPGFGESEMSKNGAREKDGNGNSKSGGGGGLRKKFFGKRSA
jgi:hypothetical protein